ncbi:MAG TPA: hypothetical protein VN231_08355 [Allosphingosinicella sp.]|nr:hypothetical protein [Allosphingosinicella sp.]
MALIFPPRPDAGSHDLKGFFAELHALEDDKGSESFVAACAEALAKLANNRDLIGTHVAALGSAEDWAKRFSPPQSFFLGQTNRFAVRANVWLPPKAESSAVGKLERKLYAYELAHNHDVNFLTVGYFGPGYETDLFEIDDSAVAGEPGEKVDLGSPRRARLSQGTVIYFRAHKDIHIQHEPPSLSISINLMFDTERNGRDQLLFDVENKRVVGPPPGGTTGRWEGLLRLAAIAGDPETDWLLAKIAAEHSNRRLADLAAAELAARQAAAH